MARFQPTKFEIYRESTKGLDWANYTNENILLSTHPYSRKAQDLTDKVAQLISSSMPTLSSKAPTLWDSLVGKGRERVVDADEVEWMLRGEGTVETLALENVMPGVKYPGHNFQEFQVKLDTERFVVGDIIAPEIDKASQIIVQYLPVKDGIGFIYTGQLATTDSQAYFDPELLEANLKWVKIGSVYGEASRDYGSTWMTANTSYIKFRTNLSDWGKRAEITNKAHQLNLVAVSKDKSGAELPDYPRLIIAEIEANMLAEAKVEKNMMIWYGRATGNQVTDSSSKYQRRYGPGVEEFFEDSNYMTYTKFDVDLIRDWLQTLGWDRISPENSNITIFTGRMGMTQAHDSIREKYLKLNVHVPWEKFVKEGPSYPGSQSGGYALKTPSFLSIDLFPYGSITFEHLPILDNRDLNGSLTHPDTGLPLTSYYYYIMDYGLGSHGNVELLRKKDSEVYTYLCGTWSPAGPINSKTSMSKGYVSTHPGRYYELVMADTFGVRIKDVNLCAMILPHIGL